MKHTLPITAILIGLFLITQVFGLLSINAYLDFTVDESGKRSANYDDTVLGPQPELQEAEKSQSAIWIIFAVLLGTALVFGLIKFRLGKLWKYWFLFAVWMTVSVTFNIYIQSGLLALSLGLALAIIKVFRPNPIAHNLTEVLMYTGITVIILPLMNVTSAIILLVLISIYDMIAVWKSKHMITLAKFQTKSKLFAGLMINYHAKDIRQGIAVLDAAPKQKKQRQSAKKRSNRSTGMPLMQHDGDTNVKSAILGGGDMAFPLIFSAVIMQDLVIRSGMTKWTALLHALIITISVSAALAGLLLYGKKDRFYPAMPFLSAGCLAGYGMILLINLL